MSPGSRGGVTARPAEQGLATASWVHSARAFIAPLALAQFICSYAGSNMNVMINDITHDLHTDVKGVQTTITLFLLIMAVLMIPCSKLTDRWGRKRCFTGGLILYGTGALLSAIAPRLGVLILGYSVFEGVGTAFLIPPVYILTTMAFTSLESRAKAFGVISGMGGIGRGRTVDRRRDHVGPQLEVGVRVPGPSGRDDHPAQPSGRRSGCP
jgi:predicted MFS family arabinose efflux permease